MLALVADGGSRRKRFPWSCDHAVLSRDASHLASSASVAGVRGLEPQALEGLALISNQARSPNRFDSHRDVEEGSVLETQRLAASIGIRSHVSTLTDLPSETSSIRQ